MFAPVRSAIPSRMAPAMMLA